MDRNRKAASRLLVGLLLAAGSLAAGDAPGPDAPKPPGEDKLPKDPPKAGQESQPQDPASAKAKVAIENCPIEDLGGKLAALFKVRIELDSDSIAEEFSSGRVRFFGGGNTKTVEGGKIELYVNYTGTGRAYIVKTEKEISLGALVKEMCEAFRWGHKIEKDRVLIASRRKFPPAMSEASFKLQYGELVPVETVFMYGAGGDDTMPIQDAVRCFRNLVWRRTDLFSGKYDPAERRLAITDEAAKFNDVKKAVEEAIEALDLPMPKAPVSQQEADALLDEHLRKEGQAVAAADAQAALDAASKLGHEDYHVRHKARQDLLGMGAKAIPGIVAARASQDPEVQEALREILPDVIASDILAAAGRFNAAAGKCRGKKGDEVPGDLLELATPRMRAFLKRKGANPLQMPGQKPSELQLVMRRDRAMLMKRAQPGQQYFPGGDAWGATLYPEGWKIERVLLNVLDLSGQ